MLGLKDQVRDFWDSQPCGSKFSDASPGSAEFFLAIEKYRYTIEPHIREMARFDSWEGRLILEVGCGLGTDGVQFARAGAHYIGIDISMTSLVYARDNCLFRFLPTNPANAEAEALPFPDNSFDLVYSHGVLHHTPDIQTAVREIHRVLKPGGEVIVMLYNRNSFNYRIGIMGLRRLGALLLLFDGGVGLVHQLTGENPARLRMHQARLRQEGLSYLSSRDWISWNTDGAGNPLSQVFGSGQARALFSPFRSVETKVRLLNKGWIPVVNRVLPQALDRWLGRLVGWHLYVLATK